MDDTEKADQPATEKAKVSKADAEYEDRSKHWPQLCITCSMFQLPHDCTLVEGHIYMRGRCKFWAVMLGSSQRKER